jgi:hypothetical protein
MRTIRFITSILIVTASGFYVKPLAAQEGIHRIIDFVELPAELKLPGDSACFIEFREQWTFLAKGSLNKVVTSHELSCSRESKDLSLPNGSLRIKDISYEFVLLDPHLVESANQAFSEPDSMDSYTRKLQANLIELIESYAPMSSLYDPRQQMLSVYFHEEWIIDSGTGEFTKRVKGLTPVIWQRRQTSEGKSINDGDTGLPVYYKTPLQRIALRQP